MRGHVNGFIGHSASNISYIHALQVLYIRVMYWHSQWTFCDTVALLFFYFVKLLVSFGSSKLHVVMFVLLSL
jgi:hypothetical protein